MTYQILRGDFNAFCRVMLIGTRTGDRMVLEKGLKQWTVTPSGESIYCTAKRHNGPMFNSKGVCTSGQDLIAVNYVELSRED